MNENEKNFENEMILEIVKLIKEIMHHIKLSLDEEFKKMDVTESQAMVLRVLIHDGEMKVSDISKRLDLSNSTVSGIIDRLVDKGIVIRKRSQKDRRVVMISMSDDFREPLRKHFEAISKKLSTAVSVGNQDDLDLILKALEKLKAIFIAAQKNDEKGENGCLN